GGLEPGYARNGRVRADVDEYAVADQRPPAAVVQLHLERLRAHEPTRAHDELGAARLEAVQLPGDLVVDHVALAVADRRHVDLDTTRPRAELGAVAHQRRDLGAPDLVLAGQAIDVDTGATDPSALNDGGPSTRSRHVPGQEPAARSTAKDQDFKSIRLRHDFLLHCRATFRRPTARADCIPAPAASASEDRRDLVLTATVGPGGTGFSLSEP